MSNYPLFSVMGVEIEYMLVDKDSLNVQPKSDVILQALAGGEQAEEVALDKIAVSNELVLHVLELKNNGPAPPSEPIADYFQQTIEQLQPLLESHHLQFLPTGAHPWMEPEIETQRWPHGNREIYQQFDKIFNCKGHGWSNLQSMHLNLPFANEEEFFQLHNAIRLILPLIPALAASTPFLAGQLTGMQDSRLDFYGKNQARIPCIAGDIIPEFIHSHAEYQQTILTPMYQAIQPYDPDKILQYEWLNSRAAIAKFAYNAIEIRIIDSQECVKADIAIAKVLFAILKHWLHHSHYFLTNPYPIQHLKQLYDTTRMVGFAAAVDDRELKQQWQLTKGANNCRAVWAQLIEKVSTDLDHSSQQILDYLLSQGNLSERLIRACGNQYNRTALSRIYRQLGHCLLTNQLFNPL